MHYTYMKACLLLLSSSTAISAVYYSGPWIRWTWTCRVSHKPGDPGIMYGTIQWCSVQWQVTHTTFSR